MDDVTKLHSQLVEAKASAEAWQENCRLTEEELEKERNKHASSIGKLAERDAEVNKLCELVALHTCYTEQLEQENAALREEVERLKSQPVGYYDTTQILAETRKQTAAEILDLLTQEEIRRITSVGDPRVTTISSKLLAMMTELRQRYGLEG